MAAEAVSLEKFSETTGLSTDTLQALTQAAAKHGVSADEATGAIVRFTSSWAQAREGGGSFLIQLQKINPALADQMQRTKDSGVAFEILTKAIQQADSAGDVAQRNLLLRAAGGRGGVAALTGVSAAVGDAGGLGSLTQDAVEAGRAINGNLLNEVKALQTELDETKKHADLLMGTVGAKQILETGVTWQKMRVSMAETVIELEKGEATLGPWDRFFAQVTRYQNGLDLTPILKSPNGLNQPALNQMPVYPVQTSGLEGPTQPKDTKAQLTDLREQISLLGSAATANDKLQLRLLELKAAVDGNATAENKLAAARGMSAAQLDTYLEKLNLHNAALGSAASVNDIVAAKMATLQKQQMQGAGLTNSEIDNVRRLAEAHALGTYAMTQQADAMRIEVGSFGVSVSASVAWKTEKPSNQKEHEEAENKTNRRARRVVSEQYSRAEAA